VRRLYDGGLLVSPHEAAGDTTASFAPEHRLRVAPGIRLRHDVRFLPDGRAVEVLACGSVEIELDDPSMLGVGRRLVQLQHGFTASDVSGWPAEVLPWERVAETLEALLSLGVIEHVRRA